MRMKSGQKTGTGLGRKPVCDQMSRSRLFSQHHSSEGEQLTSLGHMILEELEALGAEQASRESLEKAQEQEIHHQLDCCVSIGSAKALLMHPSSLQLPSGHQHRVHQRSSDCLALLPLTPKNCLPAPGKVPVHQGPPCPVYNMYGLESGLWHQYHIQHRPHSTYAECRQQIPIRAAFPFEAAFQNIMCFQDVFGPVIQKHQNCDLVQCQIWAGEAAHVKHLQTILWVRNLRCNAVKGVLQGVHD
ncbi:hypothetical protein B0H13DRAFT_1871092 [Mycena leptocephala]|nr:hypothetical protein B0H13DRAFT_1871092 [Mycena leptocephala]